MEARQRNQSLLIGNRDAFARMRAQMGKTREPKSVMVQKHVGLVFMRAGALICGRTETEIEREKTYHTMIRHIFQVYFTL